MSFYSWLHQPNPVWKDNLDKCHPQIFKELRMSRTDVERILEKLDEYEIFNEDNND